MNEIVTLLNLTLITGLPGSSSLLFKRIAFLFGLVT